MATSGFGPFGPIGDIFISKRACLHSATSYAFVRFKDLESARNAIHKLKEVVMDGHKLKGSTTTQELVPIW